MTRTVPPSEPEAQTATAPKDVAPAVALHTGTSNVRALLTSNLRQSGIYIAFVAIIALFTVLTDGTLLSPGNVTNIVLQYSYILILAIGMVIVIIAGHIDLSVDRKSTRLNSSHANISYAVFCLKKKKKEFTNTS